MPGSVVRCFADPWEFTASIRDSNVKAIVTAPGAYQARMTRIELERLRMQRAEVSLPQVTYSAVKDLNTIYFLSDFHQLSIYDNGVNLSPGVIVVSAPGAIHHRRISGQIRWGSLALGPDSLAASMRALIGRDDVARVENRFLRPPPHLMARLLNVHEAAGRLAASVPDILAHPEVSRAIEQELLQVMIRCLADGVAGENHRSAHQQPVMQRLEHYLTENSERAIYMPEVCAAIGVSGRTLRYYCEEHLGMSPHKYFWMRRMHLARKVLVSADSATTTVTAVATEYGFWELGRFAVQYRRLFGESPSETLRGALKVSR